MLRLVKHLGALIRCLADREMGRRLLGGARTGPGAVPRWLCGRDQGCQNWPLCAPGDLLQRGFAILRQAEEGTCESP